MRRKVNVKSLVIFGVLGVVMILVVLAVSQVRTFMSGATSDVEPQSVTVVSGDDGKSAVVSWISDKESISKIEYGTTAASLVLMAAETSAMTNHSVSLSSLRPSTTYYFRIRIGDEVFDNGGIPYTFKTKADTTLVTVTPTVAIVTPSVGTDNVVGTVCSAGVDYNGDGVINSMDLSSCKNSGGSIVASEVVPTVAAVSPAADFCTGTITDYNSDGIVNSLDRINCLQSRN